MSRASNEGYEDGYSWTIRGDEELVTAFGPSIEEYYDAFQRGKQKAIEVSHE